MARQIDHAAGKAASDAQRDIATHRTASKPSMATPADQAKARDSAQHPKAEDCNKGDCSR